MKSTQENIEGIYKAALENGGKGTLLVRIPKELAEDLKWSQGQDMEIQYTESCTDEGEFHAVCVTNVSLGKVRDWGTT